MSQMIEMIALVILIALVTISSVYSAFATYQNQQDIKALTNATKGMLKEQEAIKPTIDEYGDAYCVCGENVGVIPNSKDLPSVRSKYCPECGRRMKWE